MRSDIPLDDRRASSLRAHYSRAGMIGCHSHNGEQECHTLPPIPTLIAIVRAQHGSALAAAFTCETRTTSHEMAFPYSHTTNYKTQKESRPRLPSTADPGLLDGSNCPPGPDPCADSCSPLSCGATEADSGISQSANLSLTAPTNQPPLPTISDTDGLAGKYLYLMRAPLQPKCCSSVHETGTTVSKRAAG